MGARADSYYEYLYKQYLQTKQEFFLHDFTEAMNAILERLVKTTHGQLKLTYIGERIGTMEDKSFSPKMDHLVCFLSGTLALSYYHEVQKQGEKSYRSGGQEEQSKPYDAYMKLAEDLARTCHHMYNLTATGLAPEIAIFQQDPDQQEFFIKPADAHNLLRPEFVESLFFMYHITKKQIYRDWGLQVFNAFEKYCRVEHGYTTISDVTSPDNVRPKDKMESFWIAETLKYLYLLFMDDERIVDSLLNDYVFNTEGHLMLRRSE